MKLNTAQRIAGSTSGKDSILVLFAKENEKLFQIIAKQVLSQYDVVLCYKASNQDSLDEEDLPLFKGAILLITEQFYHDPHFVKDDLPLLQKANLFLIPIIFNARIKDRTNELFGLTQTLMFFDPDQTVLSFQEKFLSSLNNILVNQDQKNAIKKSFDSFVFLSYRKKDRSKLNYFLDTLQKSKELDGMGFWYDEFLLTGENFESSIQDELKNSNEFVLIVTANILEKNNYVQSVEYPFATQEGKKIIPIQFDAVDLFQLGKEFKDLPELIDIQDENFISRLKESLKVEEKKRSPEEEYFLGLAFSNGIYTKKNAEKALLHFQNSAEEGYSPAIDQMVDIYRYGKGVTRDEMACIELLLKKLESLEDAIGDRKKLPAFLETVYTLLSVYNEFGDRDGILSSEILPFLEVVMQGCEERYQKSKKEEDLLFCLESFVKIAESISSEWEYQELHDFSYRFVKKALVLYKDLKVEEKETYLGLKIRAEFLSFRLTHEKYNDDSIMAYLKDIQRFCISHRSDQDVHLAMRLCLSLVKEAAVSTEEKLQNLALIYEFCISLGETISPQFDDLEGLSLLAQIYFYYGLFLIGHAKEDLDGWKKAEIVAKKIEAIAHRLLALNETPENLELLASAYMAYCFSAAGKNGLHRLFAMVHYQNKGARVAKRIEALTGEELGVSESYQNASWLKSLRNERTLTSLLVLLFLKE